MKIIWEHTYMLTENPDTAIQLPPGMLNIHPFRHKGNNVAVPEYYSVPMLTSNFVDYKDPSDNTTVADEDPQPSIVIDSDVFLQCCENLLSLHSFYNYSGEHCHDAILRKVYGTFDLKPVL